MSRFALFSPRIMALGAVLATSLALSPISSAEEECGEYGTSVIFADSVIEAAKQAQKAEKLVFVLHVSGHFEDSDYT